MNSFIIKMDHPFVRNFIGDPEGIESIRYRVNLVVVILILCLCVIVHPNYSSTKPIELIFFLSCVWGPDSAPLCFSCRVSVPPRATRHLPHFQYVCTGVRIQPGEFLFLHFYFGHFRPNRLWGIRI